MNKTIKEIMNAVLGCSTENIPKTIYQTDHFDKIHKHSYLTVSKIYKDVIIHIPYIKYSEDYINVRVTKNHITLTYCEDIIPTVNDKRESVIPIDISTPEEFFQYEFVTDMFGLDFESYKCIMMVHKKYEGIIWKKS